MNPRSGHGAPGRRRIPLPALLVALVLVLGAGGALVALQPWHAEEPAGPAPSAEPTSTSPDQTPSQSRSQEPTAQEATFTIGAVGDVLPHDTPIQVAHTGGDDYDFTPMLEATRPWSEGVDLAICNMEVPLSMPGETPSGYPQFGAPEQIVGNLAGLGWDGCATGTNHTLDRGADNAEYTLDVFDENGMGHAGSARSQAEADAPQMYDLERGGQSIRVAQIASTYGTNGIPVPADAPWVVSITDADTLISQAKAAREQGADIVIASLHWGIEYELAPNEEQTQLAQQLADSGEIDLIIGNHPHVPQPMAKLSGGPDGDGMWVAYSLGNFVSNQDSACCIPETATGIFATATVTKPADGPARVTGMGWTPITVDREGQQRAYPLVDLTSGERPEGLTLSEDVLADRMSRVQAIMDGSTGADFDLLTTPPEPTGEPPEAQPRDG